MKDTDVSVIEKKIGCGQAEELIDQVNLYTTVRNS